VTNYLVLHIIGLMLMANCDNIHSPSFLISVRIYLHRLNEFVFAKNDAVYREREGVGCMDGQEDVRHR
jgi:hypothetical protein